MSIFETTALVRVSAHVYTQVCFVNLELNWARHFSVQFKLGLSGSATVPLPRVSPFLFYYTLLCRVYTSNMIDLNKEQENPSSGRSRFSKTSVFGKFPWFNAMFKIKSLWYKDLILNSTGCRKNNRFLRQPAHYRIFAQQKYDTTSVPCVERGAWSSPRRIFVCFLCLAFRLFYFIIRFFLESGRLF